MKDYNANTDWTRNKNSATIIYPNADGSMADSFRSYLPCSFFVPVLL